MVHLPRDRLAQIDGACEQQDHVRIWSAIHVNSTASIFSENSLDVKWVALGDGPMKHMAAFSGNSSASVMSIVPVRSALIVAVGEPFNVREKLGSIIEAND